MTIGFTLDRPVNTKTIYGICKNDKGNECVFWNDTKTKSVRTVPWCE